MKATGIVRRIDDLGRIVIPKEIRRTLRTREADPLEIFTDREGEIILKKYGNFCQTVCGEHGAGIRPHCDDLRQGSVYRGGRRHEEYAGQVDQQGAGREDRSQGKCGGGEG